MWRFRHVFCGEFLTIENLLIPGDKLTLYLPLGLLTLPNGRRTKKKENKMIEKTRQDDYDYFPKLSRKVMELVARMRESLFALDGALAGHLMTESAALAAEIRKAEGECQAGLLVGICMPEERLHLVKEAQRCSRLGRIVHQTAQIGQNLQEIIGQVCSSDIEAFKPIYLMAEVELKDAVLSIIRNDKQLAYGVQKKDAELDELYASEMKRIFSDTASAMFYNFQTGTSLLFILRAIERIGDHAKQLAVPSFYLLTADSTPGVEQHTDAASSAI